MAYLDYKSNVGPNLSIHPAGTVYQTVGKRFFDVVLALVLLLPIALILGAIALISGTKLQHFFFAHKRIGLDGNSFKCWKIRTMSMNADQILRQYLANNPVAAEEWRRTQKLQNDPRVTRFGRILRRTSLDELPQIWNVLRGEMSFVGPRPITWAELHHYGLSISEYMSVRPGITGLWQIYGRANGCYIERVKMDRLYCHTVSAYGDLKLILMTGFVVLRATGK